MKSEDEAKRRITSVRLRRLEARKKSNRDKLELREKANSVRLSQLYCERRYAPFRFFVFYFLNFDGGRAQDTLLNIPDRIPDCEVPRWEEIVKKSSGSLYSLGLRGLPPKEYCT